MPINKYFVLHKDNGLKRLNMKKDLDWEKIEKVSMQDYSAAMREFEFKPQLLFDVHDDKDEYLKEFSLE